MDGWCSSPFIPIHSLSNLPFVPGTLLQWPLPHQVTEPLLEPHRSCDLCTIEQTSFLESCSFIASVLWFFSCFPFPIQYVLIFLTWLCFSQVSVNILNIYTPTYKCISSIKVVKNKKTTLYYGCGREYLLHKGMPP